MGEYISREKAIKELREVYEQEYPTASGDFDEYASHDVPNVLRNMKAADVQPVPQWISVDDRLPKSEKEVLVWYKYTWDAVSTSYGFGINRWYSNTKQWREGCLLKNIEVLYWQPLPEPPKDGDAK